MTFMLPTQSLQSVTNKLRPLFPLIAAALLLGGNTSSAEVYKWTDSAGKTHYGDKPFGQAKATRVEVTTSPETETATPLSAATSHNGGYSDTLNSCLASGGSQTDCVARASAAQTDKAANERRLREEANRNRAQNASYQRSAQTLPSNDQATARRAAELARQRSERREREMRWR